VARRPFAPQSGIGTLARIPLLPACPRDPSSPSADALLAEGMFLASRQTGAAIARAGHQADPGRLAATLRGYEIRARSRPTPHGVFAGVALARFAAEAASLHMGSDHRARTSMRPGWLAAVCAQVLADPGVLPLLTFTASSLVTRRGQRFEHEHQAVPGATGPQRITVRATDATELIMRVCRPGATAEEMLRAVARRWPAVPESLVSDTLLGLVRSGFLLTDLLPADLSDDPLGHLLSKIPVASPLREPLGRLRQLLADADRYPPGEAVRLAALTAARDLADEIGFDERPLAVDVAADARLVLPPALADEAAVAAGVLWQISPGRDPLTGYHGRFLDRYGPHRFVPLLEATDPAIGLDLDLGDAEADGVPWSPRRAAALATLLDQAIAHGVTEVVLDAAGDYRAHQRTRQRTAAEQARQDFPVPIRLVARQHCGAGCGRASPPRSPASTQGKRPDPIGSNTSQAALSGQVHWPPRTAPSVSSTCPGSSASASSAFFVPVWLLTPGSAATAASAISR